MAEKLRKISKIGNLVSTASFLAYSLFPRVSDSGPLSLFFDFNPNYAEPARLSDRTLERYKLASWEYIKNLAESDSYPRNFNLRYAIVANEGVLGGPIEGSFALEKRGDTTTLEAVFDHKMEKKVFYISERIFGDSIRYEEHKYDLTNDSLIVHEFGNLLNQSQENRRNTVISLIERFLSRELPIPNNYEFMFKGRGEWRSHTLETGRKNQGVYDRVFTGNIEDNSPKIDDFVIFCLELNEKFIPVELRCQQRVRLPDPLPDESMEIRAVLVEPKKH